jgi:hypothetical protein
MGKTAGKTPRGRPFQKGDDERRGVGKPGRSGRRPFAITLAAQEITDKHDLLGVARDIALSAEKDSDRLAAIRLIVEYGYGRAPQHVTLANDAERPVTSPLDDLTRQLARLAPRG